MSPTLETAFVSTSKDNLYFEVLIEPNLPYQGLSRENWNELLKAAIRVVRESARENALRPIVVGSFVKRIWNPFSSLPERSQLDSRSPIIVALQYYDPFDTVSAEQLCNKTNPESSMVSECPASASVTEKRSKAHWYSENKKAD